MKPSIFFRRTALPKAFRASPDFTTSEIKRLTSLGALMHLPKWPPRVSYYSMEALTEESLMTPEQFLAFERDAEQKHEYVGGMITAMAGASRRHNRIAGNLFTSINAHLNGLLLGPCEAFVSDMKVRIEVGQDRIFYYPDILVTCDERDRHEEHFVRFPKLIIEVLSPSTERLDRTEKLFAYLHIPALEEYVLVSQEQAEALIFRKEHDWSGALERATLDLRSIGLRVPFSDILAGLQYDP